MIEIDDREAQGMLKVDIAKQINTALMGHTVSTVTLDDEVMDIVVNVDVEDINDLYNFRLHQQLTMSRYCWAVLPTLRLQKWNQQ